MKSRYLLDHPVLQQRLQTLGAPIEIPALPDLYVRMREIVQSPTGNAARIGALLANDPALSLKVLKTVNSPAFGLRQTITKVDQAVSLLGMNEISAIVLSATIVKSIPTPPGHRRIDVRKFWEHSMATALFTRMLGSYAHRFPAPQLDQLFLAGLVHDVGKLAMYHNFTGDYVKTLDKCKADKSTIMVAEQSVFGFTHQDIGALIADEWGFDRNLVKALEMHNTPDDLDISDDSFITVALVHVADVLAHALRLGDAGDPFVPNFSSRSYDALGIDIKTMRLLIDQGVTAFAETKELLA